MTSDSAESKEPKNTPLRQQQIRAIGVYFDPYWVIAFFTVLGAVFVPTGYKLKTLSDDVVEVITYYDDSQNENRSPCRIDQANEARSCLLEVPVPKDMKAPIFVYYKIDGFYQNHRQYAVSRDDYQLLGATTQSDINAQNCEPLNKLGDVTINPCGFIANTFFNDIISLENGDMREDGIAWKSDVDYLFAQPDGFNYEECKACNDSDCSCAGDDWSCDTFWTDSSTGKCYRYFYPNDDTTQYLYETYPMKINPLEGVTNEHFIVWMRVSALPNFRKLYGYMEEDIPQDSVLRFNISANFDVRRFGGAKALVVTTNNAFGGRNAFLGPSFMGVGVVCLGLAFLIALQQLVAPRKTGDRSYLKYKKNL